ncbi:hypothetical protein P6144_12095 [Sphingomonas sp. HITSZ_GF]|uniref:hypothetical protein n=1 Tax=Sphingomonas sp. HITSZ_GF TaxID=3037247 RepID=UPI00240D2C12|nr:hypothetical protein [Sphingomonas sp. HITSZ_GF]MDG2534395.1 hypothetical protein [Sphingomonas sp. HITSZ_GF]
MGNGARLITVMLGCAALAACKPDAPKPVQKAEAAPVATTPAPAAGPLQAWLVGSWSFESSCASDFIAHYGADGALDNSGELGSWAVNGDTITETIRERYDSAESDGSQKVNPPETRDYTVERLDQDHGMITYQGRKVPMLRC